MGTSDRYELLATWHSGHGITDLRAKPSTLDLAIPMLKRHIEDERWCQVELRVIKPTFNDMLKRRLEREAAGLEAQASELRSRAGALK